MSDETGNNGLPRHVALIMDGNGRWAKERGQPRSFGHREGAERARDIVERAARIGVPFVTVYAFSSENWRRPTAEVDMLMQLFAAMLERSMDELKANGVRIRFIGDRGPLNPELLSLMERAEAQQIENLRVTFTVALNYGSRNEIVGAARTLAAKVAAGELTVEAIDEDALSSALETNGIPDPDLMVRTSGELRISNYLLWQLAYSELAFVDQMWPDFTADVFEETCRAFARRERRFGGLLA